MSVTDFTFEVVDEAPPVNVSRGRKSPWPDVIKAAGDAADAAAKAKPPRRAPDGGAPWGKYKAADGEPVSTSVLTNLRQKYGKTSQYAQDNAGEFFEFEITDRVQSGKASWKGTLWVRRGKK